MNIGVCSTTFSLHRFSHKECGLLSLFFNYWLMRNPPRSTTLHQHESKRLQRFGNGSIVRLSLKAKRPILLFI